MIVVAVDCAVAFSSEYGDMRDKVNLVKNQGRGGGPRERGRGEGKAPRKALMRFFHG